MQRRSIFEALSFDATYHPSLWFDRFAPSTGGEKFSDTERDTFIGQMCALRSPAHYEEIFRSWREDVEDAGALAREYKTVSSTSIAANLGGASLLENGIALHSLYGVPYLSGRSLKGLASRFARNHLGDQWKRGTESATTLFGSADAASYVTFLDSLALPQPGSYFRREVMTPHHSPYYGTGRDAPTDRDKPIPIHFLTVRARFLICVVGPDQWREAAFDILTMALKEEGIGGKTKLGAYGRLEPVSRNDEANVPTEWLDAQLSYEPHGGNKVRCTREGMKASARLKEIDFGDDMLKEQLQKTRKLVGVTITVIAVGKVLQITAVRR